MIDEHVFCTIMKWFFEKFHFISVRQNTVIVPFLNRRNKWEIVAHKRIAPYRTYSYVTHLLLKALFRLFMLFIK